MIEHLLRESMSVTIFTTDEISQRELIRINVTNINSNNSKPGKYNLLCNLFKGFSTLYIL